MKITVETRMQQDWGGALNCHRQTYITPEDAVRGLAEFLGVKISLDLVYDALDNILQETNKKTLTFEQKRTRVLREGFKGWEKDVVETWYDIESEDEDMSTEYLTQRVADDTGLDDYKVLEIMGKFSEKYDEMWGEDDD